MALLWVLPRWQVQIFSTREGLWFSDGVCWGGLAMSSKTREGTEDSRILEDFQNLDTSRGGGEWGSLVLASSMSSTVGRLRER